MKKIISLVLAFCIVFAFASEAFAAGKPTITKQPETSTTSKKGAVSFSISLGTCPPYSSLIILQAAMMFPAFVLNPQLFTIG